MTLALLLLIRKIYHVYIDNIIIWSNSIEEHINNIQRVLQAFKKTKLYYFSKKTKLFTLEINFLEHVILAKSICTDLTKINKILDWPAPRSTIEVWGFLELVRYLVTFIYYLAEYTVVLDELVSKKFNKIFLKWSQKHQNTLERINVRCGSH